jgi:hypothetical protein
MSDGRLFGIVTVGLLAVNALGTGAQRDSPPDAPDADALAGSWTLVSYTRATSGGNTIYPFGKDGFGRLIYQRNGTMALVLMRRDRTKLSRNWSDLTPEDSHAIIREFFAYSGTYTVDSRSGTVIHHVEACSNPGWVGVDQVRKIERIGKNRIVLRPAESPASEVIWQREP